MALADVIPLPERPRAAQAEERYTRVAHGVLEALALADLGKRHYKVLLVLMRQTYGYDKAADEISLTQFHDKTGVLPPNVSSAIDELVDMRVVIKVPGKHAACLSINKELAQWTGKAALDLTKVRGYQNDNSGVIETISGGYQNDKEGVIDSITTRDNSKRKDQETTPRETLSRSLRERFEIFWECYPRKRSKKAAEKAFAKVNPDEQLFNDLMAGLERAKTSEQWQNPKFQPHAATWLNDGGWMDEFQTAYSDAEMAVIRAFNEALGERIGTVDAAVFVEARAGAIRAFLAHLKNDPEAAGRYFPAVRDKVELPPHAGFDYLISPKGFGDTTGRMRVAKPAGAAPGVRGDWHTTGPGIAARGAELGITQGAEENAVAFRRRVFKAAGPGIWRDQDLAAEAKYGDEAYERLWRFYNDGESQS
ncbi:TPA: replication protein [Burkholderia vietnamiensis]|uniref:replication protein n=1 Tax=Burkholderia vietnamiensis TaxID=60552 RepID=UPI001B98960C|nr:replication protein [Burkholderia vietnamiensis]MBR7910025.1 replication protein [Burkholderia vietnamiensis]MCA7943242.1 replication protein [Burkholderia vietnamiensis]HDR9274235.1 replication protein [Burkholderia vietnamiensis]